MTENELREAIGFLDAHLRAIHESGETRSLEADEQTRFDEGFALRKTYQADLDKIVERKAVVAALPANGGKVEAPAVHTRASDDPFDLSEVRTFGRSPVELGRELRDRALRVIERAEFVADEHRDQAERTLRKHDTRDGALAKHILATGSDQYRSAFVKKMLGDEDFTPEERHALTLERAMSTTAANGGYAIPFLLDPTIILTNTGTVNHLREISTVKKIVGSNKWNGVSSAGVTASYDAEAAEVSDDSPTLAQPSIQTEMARAFVPHSIEAEEDIASLAEDLVLLFGDAKDRLEATKFTIGAGHGSTEPKGVITAVAAVAGSRVAATTDDVFAIADIYKVLNALPARHRRNASWMAQLATYNAARQFATANNYHAYWTDLSGDTPAKLAGKAAYEAEDMDGVIDASANNDILLLGDFKNFYIVDRVGMSVEFIPHLFSTANGRPTGQRGWFAYWRNGSDVVNADAFRLLRV